MCTDVLKIWNKLHKNVLDCWNFKFLHPTIAKIDAMKTIKTSSMFIICREKQSHTESWNISITWSACKLQCLNRSYLKCFLHGNVFSFFPLRLSLSSIRFWYRLQSTLSMCACVSVVCVLRQVIDMIDYINHSGHNSNTYTHYMHDMARTCIEWHFP